ncbi:hypothetical protein jhhlp_006024 [Lomentospora prolificans]|uniref:Dioxygenase n=1 Tax=Lomentospora prolificans TaxID=41688 RepID=A0A2N3N4R4_9PEZI|nr:hypothetical protein jhhlp_006024 [Lomentospora prolificans]
MTDSNTLNPLRFTSADEAANIKEISENMAKLSFKDWPNEAGFDGLTEHRGPIELRVKGDIPAWAAGSLYRTGPGVCKVEDTARGTVGISHWFDGLAHTHRFEIVALNKAATPSGESLSGSGVRVFYSSRRQSDHIMEDIKRYGTYRSMSFAQKADPCVGLFGKFMSVFRRPSDQANIAVTVNVDFPAKRALSSSSSAQTKPNAPLTTNGAPELGHRASAQNVFLATDAASFLEVDPATLEPIGVVSQKQLHPELKGPISAAHGKRDPETGDFFNYNMEFGRTATYRVFQIVASTGKVKILATISSSHIKPAYIHSFFLTPSYVVLCVPSVHYKYGGISIPLVGNLLDATEFNPSQPCRWLIVDRKAGKGLVAEFKTAGAFFFHSTNSFEEDGDVICELVQFKSGDILKTFYYDVLLNCNGVTEKLWKEDSQNTDTRPTLVRYRFPTKGVSGGSKHGPEVNDLLAPILEIPAPHAGELPTYNPQYSLRRHRYVYSASSRGLSTLFDSLIKTDTETREVLMWQGPIGHTPGEAIFCPHPNGISEDDGVLLSVVLDGLNQQSYLLCLDARTMKELGRAECEFAVGFGFHGRHAKAAL